MKRRAPVQAKLGVTSSPVPKASAPIVREKQAAVQDDGPKVTIYAGTRGIDTYFWLCAAHAKQRRRDGWDLKEHGTAPQRCQDCRAEEEIQ